MLVIFSGLPGVGKTTIAREVARTIAAVYLRIDSLEAAMVRAGLGASQWELGPAGYYAAHAVALDNLQNGLRVVADSVNPLKITRDDWRTVAVVASVPCLEVALVCSDVRQHKIRVERRTPSVHGQSLPTWEQVMGRAYEPWDRDRPNPSNRLILDTAVVSVADAVAQIADRALANPE